MRYAVSEGISFKKINDEVFMFDRDQQMIHSFNVTGSMVISLINEKYSLEDIVTKICEEYAIDEIHASEDVKGIVDKMISAGIVSPIEG